MSSRKYHPDGSRPSSGQVFVFGSNQSGIHGGGAARAAYEHYGAKWGVSEGHTGNAYAIPTVKKLISGPLSLLEIHAAVDRFLGYAKSHPEMQFFVTRIGCVLAGHADANIAPMFLNAPDNCDFPDTWREFL